METPDRILRAALVLFASRGYEAVGVQELAEVAETTKPPLYHHFDSKRGVLEAVVRLHTEEWLARLERAAQYRGDLAQTILSVARAFFGYASEHPTYHRLHLALWYAPPDSVSHQVIAPPLLRQHQLLEGIFTEAARDHRVLRGRQALQAIALTGVLNGFISSLVEAGVKLDARMARQASRHFLHGAFSI